MQYILHTIPKGLEEITTVLGLLGIILFFLTGHAKPRIKWTIAFLLLFTIFWRMVFSRFMVISSRYFSGLIIPFLLFALYSFHHFIQKKTPAVRWCMAIMIAIMLLNYIINDLKRNKRDLNYYAIAEVIKKSNADRKEEEFFVPGKDLERIIFLSQADNVKYAPRVSTPYENNFEKPYYPSIIDVVSDNSIIPDGSKKHICSFIRSKDSKKKINLFRSEPSVVLRINPALASIDATKSILQNGTIEAIDSVQESQKKLAAHVSNYSSFPDYYESVRTPKYAFFLVSSGTEKHPLIGIESVNPIDGQNSVSIQFDDGLAYLIFGQGFHNGQYSFSFLVQGKQGTVIHPFYMPLLNGKWYNFPICSFTIPDSRMFQIICSFDVEELKDAERFRVGVSVQNGKTLLDDLVLNKKKFN